MCSRQKAFPSFSAKTSSVHNQQIHVIPIVDSTIVIKPHLNIMISNVRLCSLVDQPPNTFHISDYISMIETWAQTQPTVKCTVFRDQELVKEVSMAFGTLVKRLKSPG